MIEEARLDMDRYKHMRIHLVDAEREMAELGANSKLNAEWHFLTYLRDLGRSSAATWLETNFDAVGVDSSVDLRARFL